MVFKHYVITRFNISRESAYGITDEQLNSDAYLSARFLLFDSYCFPSVSKQTNSNFTWLVLFNDQLPEKWRNKLEKYKEQYPNFEACFMSAEETKWINWHDTLNQFIHKKLKDSGDDAKFVLTTRLDNDDAVHLSFVDVVQQCFLEHRQEVLINFVNGLQYIPQYGVLKNLICPKSHFSTLVEEKSENIRTIFGFAHDRLLDSIKQVFISNNTRMWLEVIHSSNITNSVSFQPQNLFNDLFCIGFKYKSLEAFGIKQEIPRFNIRAWKLFFEWIFSKCKEKISGK